MNRDEIITDDPFKRNVGEWEDEYKEFKKRLNEITFNKILSNPKHFIQLFEKILRDGADRLIISPEFAEKKINKLYKELGTAERFKGSISDKKEYAKRKAREYFKKKK